MGGRRRRRGRVHPKEGVHYTGLWFNVNGLNRARRNKLTMSGSIALNASEAFTQKNLHRSTQKTLRR